eukprot:RCo016483
MSFMDTKGDSEMEYRTLARSACGIVGSVPVTTPTAGPRAAPPSRILEPPTRAETWERDELARHLYEEYTKDSFTEEAQKPDYVTPFHKRLEKIQPPPWPKLLQRQGSVSRSGREIPRAPSSSGADSDGLSRTHTSLSVSRCRDTPTKADTGSRKSLSCTKGSNRGGRDGDFGARARKRHTQKGSSPAAYGSPSASPVHSPKKQGENPSSEAVEDQMEFWVGHRHTGCFGSPEPTGVLSLASHRVSYHHPEGGGTTSPHRSSSHAAEGSGAAPPPRWQD